MYDVRGLVDLGGLSLCEGYECLIIMLFSTPETKNKQTKKLC